MKKFFSLIALVGVLAACQKENLKTAFKVDPGVATINATAISVDGKDITSDVTFSYNGQASNVFYSTESAAFNQVVSVSAVWKGYDGARNFTAEQDIPVHVLPGGTAKYDVKLTLGEIVEEDCVYNIVTKEDYDASKTTFHFLTESHSHAATHDAPFVYHDGKSYDGTYLMNPSEFILRGTLNYEEKEGFVGDVADIKWADGVAPLTEFTEYVGKLLEDNPVKYTPASLPFTVSGFAMYCAYHAIYSIVPEVSFIRTNSLGASETIATFSYTDFWGNEAGVIEDACVGHEAHYVPGHGHEDHGHSHGHGSSNAGGGIVYAD